MVYYWVMGWATRVDLTRVEIAVLVAMPDSVNEREHFAALPIVAEDEACRDHYLAFDFIGANLAPVSSDGYPYVPAGPRPVAEAGQWIRAASSKPSWLGV